jgi:hypothetical protein
VKMTFRCLLILSVLLTPVIVLADSYGAIAFLSSDKGYDFGYAHNYPNQQSASQRALSRCAQRAGREGCRIVLKFSESCAALAVGNRVFGVGNASNKHNASQYAMHQCTARSPWCQTVLAICSQGEITP